MIHGVSKNQNQTRTATSGFSLVEVLVTVFLLSLMSILILSAMSGGNSATERSRRLTGQSEIWAVQRYLHSAIGCAQSLPIPTTILSPRPVMDGNSNHLVFVTCHTVPGQYGGFYLTIISTQPSYAGKGLVDLWVEQKLFHRHGDVFAQSRSTTPRANILRGIVRLDIRYFGSKELGDIPTWHREWTDTQLLPDLVEVDVAFDPGDYRIWPRLSAHLNIDNPI